MKEVIAVLRFAMRGRCRSRFGFVQQVTTERATLEFTRGF
jgi:hypothetical protein